MRNTKIALAVLALVASTAAMANGATVYGTLDVSAAKATNDTMHLDGSGNWAGSILGITGSEELEGGLKATYALELGLNAGTGRMANGGTTGVVDAVACTSNANTTVFNRQANIGLSGDFGSIKGGLQVSPYIVSVLSSGVATNNESFYVPLFLMSGSASLTTDGATVPSTGGFFIPNSVSYSTPNIGGFSGTALTALQGPATASAGASQAYKYTAYNVGYAAGDIRVNLGYEDANTNAISATALGQSKNTALSGHYTMGPASLSAAYIDHKDVTTNASFRTYSLGGAFEATDKIQLSANYAKNNATTAQSLAVLGAQYKLSKGTSLYVTAGRGTNGVTPLYSGSSNTTGDVTAYAVGMYKSF